MLTRVLAGMLTVLSRVLPVSSRLPRMLLRLLRRIRRRRTRPRRTRSDTRRRNAGHGIRRSCRRRSGSRSTWNHHRWRSFGKIADTLWQRLSRAGQNLAWTGRRNGLGVNRSASRDGRVDRQTWRPTGQASRQRRPQRMRFHGRRCGLFLLDVFRSFGSSRFRTRRFEAGNFDSGRLGLRHRLRARDLFLRRLRMLDYRSGILRLR